MKPILEIKNVSKKFKIQHLPGGYISLREKLMAFRLQRTTTEEFWALKQVSFDIMPGQSVGIIGRNGAGKSTLLKILSKITPPTKGQIVARGRIASLLEVGTGFHPELTGRENIFFNGSLLGMKRFEIAKKFDEIVDFSGTEKFLDTQLKHFSSGMQLRLAFAVAAFLEPEILIVDEVLAVGDMEFQKKCLGKMEDVSKSGRTILFVSHQLGLVSQLCSSSVLLAGGEVQFFGNTTETINRYLASVTHSNTFLATDGNEQKVYAILSASALNSDRKPCSNFAHDEQISLEVSYNVKQQLHNTHLLIAVNNRNGQRIFSSDKLLDEKVGAVGSGKKVRIHIPAAVLTPGNYSFMVAFHCPNTATYDQKDNICHFNIYDNGSEFVQYENKWFYGDVFVNCEWNFE